ncbi:MAG: hypothetical protein IJ186_03705 [Bacilli bacterium]|nr:hypothetical protein [Bacilli bacterium]
MTLNKTKLQKIIKAIEKTKRKVYTVSELSRDTGIKDEILIDYLSKFNALIYFDNQANIKEYLEGIKEDFEDQNKEVVKRNDYVRSKDIEQYDGFIDYIYKTMTVQGGILDTGYGLTKKDIKIIKKLIKEESDRLSSKK